MIYCVWIHGQLFDNTLEGAFSYPLHFRTVFLSNIASRSKQYERVEAEQSLKYHQVSVIVNFKMNEKQHEQNEKFSQIISRKISTNTIKKKYLLTLQSNLVCDSIDEILSDTYRNKLIHLHPYKPHTNLHSDHLYPLQPQALHFYLNLPVPKPSSH